MKGLLATVLVILVGLVMAGDALLGNGENVCSVTKTKELTVMKPERQLVTVIKSVFCNPWIPIRLCKRRVREYRIKNVPKTVIKRYVDLECCPGWKSENNLHCLKAICEDGCRINENCIAPNVCEIATPNMWTLKDQNCECYFDHSRHDCACCSYGGCQCTQAHPHKCVQCGYGTMCADEEDAVQSKGIDPWTKSLTGCDCNDSSKEGGTCICCKNGGCPCPIEKGVQRCVQCGLDRSDQCEPKM